MKQLLSCLFGCAVAGVLLLHSLPQAATAGMPATFDRARFFPAKGHEQAMLHGKFCGSNTSARAGFEVLAEITSVPTAGQWTELAVENPKSYRWIRYEAPPGSYGEVAELEFYFGKRKAVVRTFGSFGWQSGRNWPRAFDGNTDSWFESDTPDGQFVGMDVGDWGTAQTPRLDPPPRDQLEALLITLKCSTPGAEIRYSLSGVPTHDTGILYQQPIRIDRTSTIFAVAFKAGMPPSPAASGTYIVGEAPKPGLHTLHVGNSLTASTLRLPDYVRTAGYLHQYRALLKDSGQTIFAWNGKGANKGAWDTMLAEMPKIDHFTVQPRAPHFGEEARAQEAKYDVLFFNAIAAKSPEFQPWIYAEWPSRKPGPRSVGWAPIFDSRMHELYPAPTFEEASSALFMHIEDIRHKVLATYQSAKRPRVLPCTLAVTRLKSLLDEGQMPGFSSGDWDTLMFYDNVHPGEPCRYMLCLTWFAAFYGQSPEGKVLPVGSQLTPAQAMALQRLAWDVVKNYPDCGLYEEGSASCEKPRFSSVPKKPGSPESTGDMRRMTIKSATPGAWFRYTLDGTTPSRTHGYVYCGVVSVPPGTTLKALAYKSGMADSAVAEAGMVDE